MAKGNVGSLLVFDPEKIDFASDDKVTSAAGDAVVGIVTERGQRCMPGFSTAMNKTCQALFASMLIVDLCLSRLLDKGCCQGQKLDQRARARCHDASQQANDSHSQPQCPGGHVNDERQQLPACACGTALCIPLAQLQVLQCHISGQTSRTHLLMVCTGK